MEKISYKDLIRILHYDPDTGIFRWAMPRPKVRVGEEAGYIHRKGYRCIELFGKHYAAHRLAWFYVTEQWPNALIDHKDCNRSNNAFANLRQATNGQNRANSKHNNKNGYKGVTHHAWLKEKPYQAQITFQKKVIYLGCYATPEEAHAAYKKAALDLHGEYARP